MSEFYAYETKSGKDRERQQSEFVNSEFFGKRLADTHYNRERIVNICLKGMGAIKAPNKSETFYVGLLKSFKFMFETPTAPLPSDKQIDALYSFLTSYTAAKYINEYQINKHIEKEDPIDALIARVEALEKQVKQLLEQQTYERKTT